VASGVLQLESTIPVLLGAGIGSTLISLLVALKITKYGLLLVSAAYFYSAWIKKKSERNVLQSTNINDFDHNGEENRGSEVKLDIADCVFGLGLIFFGSQVMGNTFGFLGKNETFVTFLEHLHSPFLGLLTGFLLTVLVNSSGAAIGILLSLSEHGLLNGRAGIAMVLGANVGTCVTACIAGFSQGRAPFEVAIALVLVRAVGALFFTVTIQPLQTLSRTICGVSIDADLALLAAEPGHVHPSQALSLDVSCQIAASHSLFNIILAVVLLPFIRLYARAVRNVAAFLLRDGKTSSPQRISPPSFEITVV
jgi:phosphate:Na+ symporter